MKKSIIAITVLILALTSYTVANAQVRSYIVRTKTKTELRRLAPSVRSAQEKPLLPQSFDARKPNIAMVQSAAALLNEMDNTLVVRFPSAEDADRAMTILRANPDVVSIEPNYVIRTEQIKPSDVSRDDQWALKAVGAVAAWNKSKGKGIVVGLVDTGIDYYHPALVPALHVNPAEDINHNGKFDPWPNTEKRNGVTGDFDGIDNDGNGFADDVIGFDFIDQYAFNFGDYSSPDPMPMDENGHGTAVGGIIAAREVAGKGIIGLAPESNLLIARAFDLNGEGESANIAAAIVYCAISGAKVINCSFGEDTDSKIVHDAIKFARSVGSLVVCSSGNSGWDEPHFPSDYEEALSVGSSNSANAREGSSNYGSRLALLAPGSNVLTTALGGEYRKASGTSMATPHVTATAALLLGANAMLSPADLSGILTLSATDIGFAGWSYEFGFGILSAVNALNSAGSTNISIHSPATGAYFDRKAKTITIVASAITPLFDSLDVSIGKGTEPTSWTKLAQRSGIQPRHDTVAILDPKDYANGTYAIRLFVKLKNSKSAEKRIVVEFDSAATGFAMDSVKATPALKDNSYVMLISAKTSSPATMTVSFAPTAVPSAISTCTEWDYITRYHALALPASVRPGEEYTAEVVCSRTDGATLRDTIKFVLPKDALPTSGFDLQKAHFPASYLMNDVADLYSNGRASFITNDIAWSRSYSYSYDADTVLLVDSLPSAWVPVGYGDSNGDGIPECFTKSRWRSILYQAKEKGASPFSSILFADTTSGNLWAAGMLDFDGDGLKDLVAYSDTAFHVFHFQNGKYSLLAQTNVEKRFRSLSTYPSYASGNFDGSGKPQIAFFNKKGQIIICKYSAGAFETILIDSANTNEATQYLVAADVDGDGNAELLASSVSSKVFFGADGLKNQARIYRLLKFNAGNQMYETIWNQTVWGIREGRTSSGADYRNGIAAGRVDGDTCETLILTPFGNTYFFKWNADRKAMLPSWYYPAGFSNSAIVSDFDKDGKNEVCISTGEYANFFKYNYGFAGPQAPTELVALSDSDTTATLRWRHSANAKDYKVYIGKSNGAKIDFSLAATQADTIYHFSKLIPKMLYYFVVIAHNAALKDVDSKLSDIVSAFTHNRYSPNSLRGIGTRSVAIGYEGPLTNRVIEPSFFTLTEDESVTPLFAETVNRINDTLLLATFPRDVQPGSARLRFGAFADYYNSLTMDGEKSFIFDADTMPKEMYLTNLKLTGKFSLDLGFSEVPTAGAEDVGNYSILPTGSVLSVTKSPSDGKTVLVALDVHSNIGAHGVTYSITVRNVVSDQGNPITKGAGNTMSFVITEDGFSGAFVSPNPIRYSDNPTIYFAGLPTNCIIEIYTLTNKYLRTVKETDNNGGVEWDGLDEFGNRLETGIYLYRVRQANADGSYTDSDLKKFAVVK